MKLIGRVFLLLLISPLITACGIFGGGDDDEDAPTKLVDFVRTVEVVRLWSGKLGGNAEHLQLGLRPVTEGQVVFAASHDGKVVAHDLETGNRLWIVETELPLAAGPAVGGGMLVVGSSDGDVVAFASADGESLWTIKTSSEVLAAAAIGRGVIVFRTVDGRLHGVDSNTGTELWEIEREVPALSLRGNSPPVLSGDLVLAGFDDGHIVAARLQTGDIVWETVLKTSRGKTDLEKLVDVDASIQIAGNYAYVAGYQAKAAALDVSTGGIEWETELSSHSGLDLDLDTVYAVTSDSEVVALDRRTGAQKWRQSIFYNRELSGPVVYRDLVIVGDVEGYLHGLDTKTGAVAARARVDNKAIIAAPVIANDIILVQTDGGVLSAYKRKESNK